MTLTFDPADAAGSQPATDPRRVAGADAGLRPPPGPPRPLRRLRRRLRNGLAGFDALYLPLARLARPGFAPTARTDLVIEGFPRSANSRLEACIRVAWGEDLRIAQHLHAAASLRLAVRRGLPAILPLRPPGPAAASLWLRDPKIHDPRLALEEYIGFHVGLARVAPHLLVIPFAAAIKDFAAVAAAMRLRFGAGWSPPCWGARQEAEAAALLDRLTRLRVGRAHVSYSPTLPPEAHAARSDRAAAALQRIAGDPALAPLLGRAQALHDSLLAFAPAPLRDVMRSEDAT